MFARIIALFATMAATSADLHAAQVEHFRTAGGTKPYTIMGYQIDPRTGLWVAYTGY